MELMSILSGKGTKLSYSDPYVPIFPKMRKHSFSLESISLHPEMLRNVDCVVIATNHDDFDYDMIADHAKLIIDTKGV